SKGHPTSPRGTLNLHRQGSPIRMPVHWHRPSGGVSDGGKVGRICKEGGSGGCATRGKRRGGWRLRAHAFAQPSLKWLALVKPGAYTPCSKSNVNHYIGTGRTWL